jgi:hypothetical protein
MRRPTLERDRDGTGSGRQRDRRERDGELPRRSALRRCRRMGARRSRSVDSAAAALCRTQADRVRAEDDDPSSGEDRLPSTGYSMVASGRRASGSVVPRPRQARPGVCAARRTRRGDDAGTWSRKAGPGPEVLIVDQLEEVFAPVGRIAADGVPRRLDGLARGGRSRSAPTSTVAARASSPAAAVAEHQHLGPMRGDQLRRAIRAQPRAGPTRGRPRRHHAGRRRARPVRSTAFLRSMSRGRAQSRPDDTALP